MEQTTQPEQIGQTQQYVQQSFSDSWCNIVKIGDLLLQSPKESMDDLIQKALKILQDEKAYSYLNYLKQSKLLSTSGYG